MNHSLPYPNLFPILSPFQGIWRSFSLKHLINKREVFLPVGTTLVVTKDGEISKTQFRFVKKEQWAGHPILKVDLIIGTVYTYHCFILNIPESVTSCNCLYFSLKTMESGPK